MSQIQVTLDREWIAHGEKENNEELQKGSEKMRNNPN